MPLKTVSHKAKKNDAENPFQLDSFTSVARSQTPQYSSYRNIQTNSDVRVPFSRSTYDYFRPNEAVPTKYADIIAMCNDVYKRNGLVKNIIDLMGDFGSKGIKIVHPNKAIQKYLRTWFDKVKGRERSERFLNVLYRLGTVFIKRQTARLTPTQHDRMRAGITASTVPYEELQKLPGAEIPIGYTFFSPLDVEILCPHLGSFVGEFQYELKIPEDLKKLIERPKTDFDRDVISRLPSDIREAIQNKRPVLLGKDKLSIYHYKKDDWDHHGMSVIHCVLDDLITLEKLKLADRSALDTVINNVRVWKLGNMEHKIPPTEGGVNKLRDFLNNNTGGGAMDVIWGPAIDLLETKTDVLAILGQEKYEPVYQAIFQGFGVPATLTGSSNGGNFTNSFISLKTLIERLEYGRHMLLDFWTKELKLLQKAKGFRFAGTVQFDHMVLSDEAAEKALWIQLMDRNVISYERVRERFGEIPEIEEMRVSREVSLRKREKMPRQADPFHNGNVDSEYKKILLQLGEVTPEQVGIDLEETTEEVPAIRKEKMQIKMNEEKIKQAKQAAKMKGVSGQGRPKNSRDGGIRKKRRVLPKASATIAWAVTAQETIGKIIDDIILKHLGKDNLRQLTNEEYANAEEIKFSVLLHYQPFSEITADNVKEKLQLDVNSNIVATRNKLVAQFKSTTNKEPSVKEIKTINAVAYLRNTDQ